MRGKFVCYTPLASSVLHGRAPQPRRLSPWALGMCAPTLLPISPTGLLKGVELPGNGVYLPVRWELNKYF